MTKVMVALVVTLTDESVDEVQRRTNQLRKEVERLFPKGRIKCDVFSNSQTAKAAVVQGKERGVSEEPKDGIKKLMLQALSDL